MSEWKKVKLGDCCEITSSKRIFLSDYVPVGIPFYRSKEIAEMQKGNTISDPLFISNDKYEEIKCKFGVPHKGDLLLTAIGATLGIPFVIKNDLPFYFKDGNLIWFKNFNDLLDPSFLYTWMCSNFGYQSMQNIAIGSAQKALTISALKDLSILVPPFDVQQHIATILSRYDSLIENYQKQIKLLEEAAQRLYKEWFVKLHFPGYENKKIIDGIPEGWEKRKIGSLIDKVQRSKQVPSSEYRNTGKTPIIDQSRNYISGYTDDLDCRIELTVPAIIFGDHTRILKYITFPFAKGADGTQLVISNDLRRMPQSLFYNSLLNVDLSNYSYARHYKYLKEEEIILPSEPAARQYDGIVSVYYKAIQNHRYQILLLTEARNRLLPKLMNGEIIV